MKKFISNLQVFFSKEKRKQFLDDKTKNIPLREKLILVKIANKFSSFVFSVGKFSAMLFIFNKIYEKIYFEKTMIILVLIIITILMSKGRDNYV